MWITFVIKFCEPISNAWCEGSITRHFDKVLDAQAYQDRLEEQIKAQYGEKSQVTSGGFVLSSGFYN